MERQHCGCVQQAVQDSLGSSNMQELSSVETQASVVVGMKQKLGEERLRWVSELLGK